MGTCCTKNQTNVGNKNTNITSNHNVNFPPFEDNKKNLYEKTDTSNKVNTDNINKFNNNKIGNNNENSLINSKNERRNDNLIVNNKPLF